MQHILHNNMFINKGGKLILIYLKIPDFIFNHDVDNYKKFKRALALLKESRGWKKLKDFTNAQFHYDNIELLFKNNKYQIIDNIVYGTMKEDVLLDYIEEIVSEYWTRCSKRIGLSIIPKNSVQVAYAIEKNSVINNNFKIFNNNLFEKSFELKRKTIGSLEYLEDQFIKIDSQPETSLVSFEYIKNKKLKEIGNIIKNINTMTRKSRQGRIWQYI